MYPKTCQVCGTPITGISENIIRDISFRLSSFNECRVCTENGQVFRPTQDPNVQIHYDAHYSDNRFKVEQVVYGCRGNSQSLFWDYDDRLREWDYEKAPAAWKHATASGVTLRSARFYEEYLRYYYDKPIDLKCIIF